LTTLAVGCHHQPRRFAGAFLCGVTRREHANFDVMRVTGTRHCGGRILALPLIPAISSGAGSVISPITLIDWLMN
jgi:hypothetical protein